MVPTLEYLTRKGKSAGWNDQVQHILAKGAGRKWVLGMLLFWIISPWKDEVLFTYLYLL